MIGGSVSPGAPRSAASWQSRSERSFYHEVESFPHKVALGRLYSIKHQSVKIVLKGTNEERKARTTFRIKYRNFYS